MSGTSIIAQFSIPLKSLTDHSSGGSSMYKVIGLPTLYMTLSSLQSSRKRRITRIGTHVFSLGRMIFARRESRVRMFF